jgi:hypothetical protein
MEDSNRGRRPGPAPRRSSSPRSGEQAGGRSAEELLEIAEDLEEEGRALIAHARKLQRLAERMQGSQRPRPPRPSTGAARGEDRGNRRPPAGGDRPARGGKKPGGAPSWAPGAKRRRPTD